MKKEFKEFGRELLITFIGFIIALFVIDEVKAEENPYILLGGVSHHFITEDYTNSVHHTFAISYNSIIGGYYKNSYGSDSFFLGYDYVLTSKPKYDLGLYIGAVRGYDKCYGEFSEHNIKTGKSKADACAFLGLYANINTGHYFEPQFTLAGDALTLSLRKEL